MTTLESTLAMVKTLPEADLLQVQSLIKKLLHQELEATSPELTTEQLQQKIQYSYNDFKEGRYLDADIALKNLRKKYGL